MSESNLPSIAKAEEAWEEAHEYMLGGAKKLVVVSLRKWGEKFEKWKENGTYSAMRE